MTTDPVAFTGTLQEGDLLLFDSLHLLSQFLKLADDRPVNHCAVFLGAGQVAHCNKPLPGEPEHAIYRTPLSDLLGLARVRTVTALRHRGVDAGASPVPVVTRASAFVSAPVPYAYVDLVRLAAPCLLRAYRDELAADHASAVVVLLRSVVGMTSAYDRSKRVLGRKGSKRVAMTCSSFAYRCYVGDPGVRGNVPFPIVLENPLATLDAPARLRTSAPPGAQPRIRAGGGAGIRGLTFHPALVDPPTIGNGATPRARWVDDMIARRATARGTVTELMRTSRPAGDELPAGPVDAAVTPRDLWGSSSFRAVAVFHRPPGGPTDGGAIDVLA
jgi:hypothetical protein